MYGIKQPKIIKEELTRYSIDFYAFWVGLKVFLGEFILIIGAFLLLTFHDDLRNFIIYILH